MKALEQNNKDYVIISAGAAINFGFGGIFNVFPLYYSPNGMTIQFLPASRRNGLGFKGRLVRMFANIPVNSRPDATTFGITITTIGAVNHTVGSIPAASVGQFDSGVITDPTIKFNEDDRISLFIARGVGIAGELIQVERLIALCEVIP